VTRSAIVLQKVRKKYLSRVVLDAAHLEIEKGRTYAVVGPNGSGKSTLLRILALLEPPTEGEVMLDGENLTAPGGSACNRARKRLCYVAQDPYMFTGTVLGNALYGLRARGEGGARTREKALDALETLGMRDFAGAQASSLSAGERQKVALARALVLRPEFLFLDEPTANVDRRSITAVENAVARAVSDAGGACLWATHDAAQARRIAGESTVHLLDGRVVPGGKENLFQGKGGGGAGERTLVLPGGVEIALSPDAEPGESCTVSVSPKEIILSRSPVQTSARNSFRGRITRLEQDDSHVWVTVDAGVEMTVRITPQSVRELELEVGSEVWAFFKAAAVKIL
jgi:tungstate transport system ATP-binding protein